ncbi:MAG: alanine/glycine:cation symporter family protein [Calditrichia bacterium]
MDKVGELIVAFADAAWGPWLLVLLLGGGIYFLIMSRFMPFFYIRHGINILRGKYDSDEDEGDITHFQALSSALAGTIGMGNIGGVAIAITVGGPGAVFWMWVSAILGVATKFFTCTLAVMYRGRDSAGHLQGGPMYVVREGLGEKWWPLAAFFSLAGLVGALPAFQVNQLTQVVRDIIMIPNGFIGEDPFMFNFVFGIFVTILVASVIFGGIKRIGLVTARIVPAMVVLYMLATIYILFVNASAIPETLAFIVRDAFTGEAVGGGALGAVIITGIRRAAFSNEAGIGTEAMAHGAAKTKEPVREGLVAMLGPLIDTMIVCTCTALVILMTGVWKTGDADGVTLTANAFNAAMPGIGGYILITCVIFFSTSTMFTYSYYGTKCLGFLLGAERQHYYNYFYCGIIVIAAIVSLDVAVSLIDGMYALMAIPTMVSAILLAPKVMAAARTYFAKVDAE